MVNQKYTSADTSINVVNRVYKAFPFKPKTTVLDYGGGKYDTNTQYMATKGVKVMVYDPFNRTKDHNMRVIKKVESVPVDYIVCSNVLNVIAEDAIVNDVVRNIAKLARDKSTVIFAIYERKKNGIGEITTKGYQRNQKTESYVKFIKQHFKNVHVYKKENLIVAFN